MALALFGSWWSMPLQIATALCTIAALLALARWRFRLARLCAIAQASVIVLGFGLAQHPFLIAPDVTIQGAAAPRATLVPLLYGVAAGALLLIPSLYILFRVFKRDKMV